MAACVSVYCGARGVSWWDVHRVDIAKYLGDLQTCRACVVQYRRKKIADAIENRQRPDEWKE